MLAPFFQWLYDAHPAQAGTVILLGNVIIFLVTIRVGEFLVRRKSDQRIAPEPDQSSTAEILIAWGNVVLNSVVTMAGWSLWKASIIQIQSRSPGMMALELVALFFAMDASMYVLHRIAHIRWLYPLVHRLHHRCENPRPLSLFVLNPLENLSFGCLWLAVLCLHSFSIEAILLYLTLNIAFGLCGHLGVQPFPARWLQAPALRWLAGSVFHARHHADPHHNFGFYTRIWDRLFRTLTPSPPTSVGSSPLS